MPPRVLSVPHKVQEHEAGCLAACAQAVLSYLGVEQTQAGLNRLFGLTSIGTPFRHIQRLANLGVSVFLHRGDETALRDAIDQNLPPILFMKTGDLPYWQGNTAHAVVMIGYDEDTVLLADPQFADSPQRVGWGELMLAWGEQDYYFALIRR